VIDDATAKNAMLKKVIISVAPKGIKTEVFSVQEAIEKVAAPSAGDERVMLIAKVPGVFEALLDAGVDLKEVNLGGMGLNKNRKPFYENVSASEAEITSMANMLDKGVKVYYQVTPHSKAVDVKKILGKG